ncbi:hypothetical protein ACFL2Q_17645 [Thermodesulfobacteriota bacterium]
MTVDRAISSASREDNAKESARVVNAINPDHLRFRSLYVKRGTTLSEMSDAGKFETPDEDEIVEEIRMFIDHLEGVETTIVSDHILNLLQELEGKLPQDKQKMLDTIDRYLGMPEEERLLFQLGRRGGALTYLDEFEQPAVQDRLRSAKRQIEKEVPGGIREYAREMKKRFV